LTEIVLFGLKFYFSCQIFLSEEDRYLQIFYINAKILIFFKLISANSCILKKLYIFFLSQLFICLIKIELLRLDSVLENDLSLNEPFNFIIFKYSYFSSVLSRFYRLFLYPFLSLSLPLSLFSLVSVKFFDIVTHFSTAFYILLPINILLSP